MPCWNKSGSTFHKVILFVFSAALEMWPSGRSTFMAKKSIKYAGTMGIACSLAGNIWVDRGNTEKSKSQTTKECLEYVTEKKVNISFSRVFCILP